MAPSGPPRWSRWSTPPPRCRGWRPTPRPSTPPAAPSSTARCRPDGPRDRRLRGRSVHGLPLAHGVQRVRLQDHARQDQRHQVAEIEDNDGFLYQPEGRMWVTEYPPAALPKAEQVYSAAELTGMKVGLVALYQKCPHLGCRVPSCNSSQWFECPCHGSQVQPGRREEGRSGTPWHGPLRHGGHRAARSSSTPAQIIQGPPIGTNTTGQEAEGPQLHRRRQRRALMMSRRPQAARQHLGCCPRPRPETHENQMILATTQRTFGFVVARGRGRSAPSSG